MALNPGGLVPGHISETWGAGQRFGILPIGQGRVCWYGTRSGPGSQPEGAAGRKAEVQQLFRDWHEPIPALIKATLAADILKTDACDRPALGEWGRGRVTLLGDAAHPMTPNIGQGACMAIEDAAELAKVLADAPDVAAGFRAYEARRQSRTAYVGPAGAPHRPDWPVEEPAAGARAEFHHPARAGASAARAPECRLRLPGLRILAKGAASLHPYS